MSRTTRSSDLELWKRFYFVLLCLELVGSWCCFLLCACLCSICLWKVINMLCVQRIPESDFVTFVANSSSCLFASPDLFGDVHDLWLADFKRAQMHRVDAFEVTKFSKKRKEEKKKKKEKEAKEVQIRPAFSCYVHGLTPVFQTRNFSASSCDETSWDPSKSPPSSEARLPSNSPGGMDHPRSTTNLRSRSCLKTVCVLMDVFWEEEKGIDAQRILTFVV